MRPHYVVIFNFHGLTGGVYDRQFRILQTLAAWLGHIALSMFNRILWAWVLNRRNFFLPPSVPISASGSYKNCASRVRLNRAKKEFVMDGQLIGLVAVTLGMSVPLGALYTYFRVRKLRSEERLAAIARGVAIPLDPELNQAAQSRRSGIVLVSGAIGFIAAFGLIAGIEADRDLWTVAAFGLIPLAVGIGYFVDWSMIRRDAHVSG